MEDRVPTKKLPNGAIRYEDFDSNGNSLGYRYTKRADEPTQEGMPLCKATLLSDSTCAALGLPTTAVPDEALELLSGAALRKTVNGVNTLTDMAGNDFPLQYVKLMDVITTANTSLVSLDVSTIDLTKYASLSIVANILTSYSGSGKITLNNITSQKYRTYLTNSTIPSSDNSAEIGNFAAGGGAFCTTCVEIFSNFAANKTQYRLYNAKSYSGAYFGGGYYLGFIDSSNFPDQSDQSLKTIEFKLNGGAISPNSRFTVYGVRL